MPAFPEEQQQPEFSPHKDAINPHTNTSNANAINANSTASNTNVANNAADTAGNTASIGANSANSLYSDEFTHIWRYACEERIHPRALVERLLQDAKNFRPGVPSERGQATELGEFQQKATQTA